MRLRYEHALCGGGYPALLAYEDGLVISPGMVGCPLSHTAFRYEVGPGQVAEILRRLRALGLFEMLSADSGDRHIDAPTIIVEAAQGRDGVRVSGWRDTDAVMIAAGYLKTVIEALEGGKPYVPDQIVLIVEPLTPANQRPGYAVHDWPLVGVLMPAREGGRYRLPTSEVESFVSELEPWTLSLVRVESGELYWLRWEPLFPHELR